MRMVGITGVNLLNLYYTTLNVGVSGGVATIAPNAKGDVAIAADPSNASFCSEPVRSITAATSLTKDIYFVSAPDFKGIKVNGSDVTVTSVVADGESLYKLASGSTITKVSL